MASGLHAVSGFAAHGFDCVRDAFIENFTQRNEAGGAVCAYVHGEKVVDLWGGVRNRETGKPWNQNTMVIVYSATKGLAAMTLALAHSRGWLDYDERVAATGPSSRSTARSASLCGNCWRIRRDFTRWTSLSPVAWPPIPIGWPSCSRGRRRRGNQARARPITGSRWASIRASCCAVWIRSIARSDGSSRTDRVATRARCLIRLPEEIGDSRLATIARPSARQMVFGFPPRLLLDTFNPRSRIVRTLRGSELPHDARRVYARNLEVPSGGGVGTARAIAHAYSVLPREAGNWTPSGDDRTARRAGGCASAGFLRRVPEGRGPVLTGLHETVRQPAVGNQRPCLRVTGGGWSDGFCRSGDGSRICLCDESDGHTPDGDPRDVALRDALHAALAARQSAPCAVA